MFKGKKLFYLLVFTYIIATVAFMDRGLEQLRLIGFAIFILAEIILPIDDAFALMVMIQPFTMIYKLAGSYSIMPFMVVVFIIRMIIASKGVIITKLNVIIPFFLLAIISVCNSYIRFNSVIETISFFVYMLMWIIAVSANFPGDVNLYNKVAILFITSTILVMILSSIFPDVARAVSIDSGEVWTHRNSGFYSVWETGRIVVVAIAFLLSLYFQFRKHLIISVLLGLLLFSFLMETGLFSGILALAILFVSIPFSNDVFSKNNGNAIKVGLILMSIIGILILYYFVFLPMTEFRGGISDNGRIEVWLLYWKAFIGRMDTMLIGVGGGMIGTYAASMGYVTAHNLIVEKLIEFGIVGVLLLIFLIKNVVRSYGITLKSIYAFPLIAFLGTCITQGVSGSELVFLVLVICSVQRSQKGSCGV